MRLALTAVALVALTGCGGGEGAVAAPPSPTPTSILVSGTITLTEGGSGYGSGTGSTCSGEDGYDDMRGGLQVVVYDDAQRIIGNSALQSGVPSGVTVEGASYKYKGCSFAFTVGGLPERPFYQVEIGTRGRQTVQRADVATPLQLSLG